MSIRHYYFQFRTDILVIDINFPIPTALGSQIVFYTDGFDIELPINVDTTLNKETKQDHVQIITDITYTYLRVMNDFYFLAIKKCFSHILRVINNP